MQAAETTGSWDGFRRAVAAYPTLLKVGFSSALAYRAELFIWILTTNLPLVNLALWTAVARETPVGRFGQKDFAAYFLAVLVVRLLTGCWVVYELTMEVREGTLAMRLLRPVHPIVVYAAENMAAIPVRAMLALPVALVALVILGAEYVSHDPLVWALVPLMMFGAWVMVFLVMAIVGTFALWVESASSLYEVWLGLYTVFSGYLVPLELFPAWLQQAAYWMPFRMMIGFPVDAILGKLTWLQIAQGFGLQVGYIFIFWVALTVLWRAGMRRYAAFGG